MNKLGIIATGFILAFNCCQKEKLDERTPECMAQKIMEFKNGAGICEKGKSVYRYIFLDDYVYVFNPGDCGADMMATVYDSECNIICGLGGIAGNVTCEGENFGKSTADETLIWHD